MTILSSVLLAAATTLTVPYRGVVEGYYGRPWGTEGRVSLMNFMGERNLNTFIYGPKDDPYHHAKWREAYPEKEAADFKKLLEVAKKNNINFYWAIHLGDFKDEYEALFKKLDSMYALGVRSFAVFFDDFGSANADLHATIGNRVIREFLAKKGNCSPLLVCPNVYWGTGHVYQKTLGAKLDKSAMIMWTGKTICSDVRAEDVAQITEDFQRPPFIWWNWPVNDYCRSKLLLGRLYGLDACTYAGVVLNPMENCELNKIAIHSFGEWCKDPVNFDSHKAWNEGFAKIFKDPEIASAMRVFALHNSDQGPNAHGYHREESVAVAGVCRAAREELKKHGDLSEETREKLYHIFLELDNATFTLVRKLPLENPRMFWEMEGWLLDEMHQMDAAMIVLDLLENRDHRHCEKAINRLYKGRHFMKLSQQLHMAKFRMFTFENDRAHVKPPHTSNKELLPIVIDLLKFSLAREYRMHTGKDFSDAYGLKALSHAAAYPNLVVFTEEGATGLERVFEQRTFAADEWIGLQIPEAVTLRSIDIRLGTLAAQKACVLEISTDGSTWQAAPCSPYEDGRFAVDSVPEDAKWKFVRVRNASNETVPVKLDIFRLKVDGPIDPAEALIDALAAENEKTERKLMAAHRN